MAIFTHYVTSLASDVSAFFEHSDVQTTTIAIAVASSLCVTVAWFVVHIVHSLQDGRNVEDDHRKELLNDACKKIVVSSFHMNRKTNGVYKQGSDKFSPRSSKQSIWSNRKVEEKCAVPCISCGVQSADKLCRFVLCRMCCLGNSATVCNVHDNQASGSYEYSHGSNRSVRKEMDLSHLKLEECPARVGYLGAQLVSLNLANNNLHVLPEEIGCLLGLQHLHLQSNSLQSLPDSIRNLGELCELDVRHNLLHSLPNIEGLSHLQALKVDHNHLTALPDSIGSLPHLQYLYAGSNALTEFPEELCNLSFLKILNVSKNSVRKLPSGMGQLVRLTELDVSLNHLEVLPWSLIQCSSLVKLNLHHNRLGQLPCHIGRLHQLEELHAHVNRLQYLPASLDALSLERLTVFPNPLWTEAQTRSVVTSSGSNDRVTRLVELTAARIIKLGMNWQDDQLPSTLKDMLRRCHHCSSCGEPLFESRRARVTFHSVRSQRLPLYQQICPPCQRTNCRFIQLSII